MDFPKLESKVAFGIYLSRVDALTNNAFLSLLVKKAKALSCATSSRSLLSFLMVHLPSKIVKEFWDNPAYAQKGINMWAQVCESQEPCTPKDLIANLQLLFFFYQGSNQETTSYLGFIWDLILQCKSGGQDYLIPLLNHIVVQNLDPSRYQKILDGYEVGSLDWYTKDLISIEKDLTLIYQHRGLVKFTARPVR